MIPHLSPWIWLALGVIFWTGGALVALTLGAIAKSADEQAARMYADHYPDEVDPGE